MDLQISGRVAVVTGGSGGIGAVVCSRLIQSGFEVVVADTDISAAQNVAANLGPKASAFHVDVTDEASVRTLFDNAESISPVSVLICVAGVLILPGGERPLIADMDLEIWERSFAVNSRGSFLCSREFLRRRQTMPATHGRVIFIGSSAAQLGGYRSSSAYIASKSAVMGFAKAYAREVAHLGITANVVSPGLIDTQMLRSTVGSGGDLSVTAQAIPLGRIGTAEDVAGAIDYLVSPQAAYVTGSVIDVNGGYRMQ